jgi:hypothetical protein
MTMSVATEKITEVEDQVLDFVSRVQEPVVDGVRTVVSRVEDRIPEINVPGLGDTVPTASELVENGFAFAQKVLDNQREFAQAVLDATAPIRHKFVGEAAKPASKTSAAKVKAA